jgi:hypothetical protein
MNTKFKPCDSCTSPELCEDTVCAFHDPLHASPEQRPVAVTEVQLLGWSERLYMAVHGDQDDLPKIEAAGRELLRLATHKDGREEALEEAARVCEQTGNVTSVAKNAIARRIRAISAKPAEFKPCDRCTSPELCEDTVCAWDDPLHAKPADGIEAGLIAAGIAKPAEQTNAAPPELPAAMAASTASRMAPVPAVQYPEGAAPTAQEMVERLQDHQNEGVTASDRYHLREAAARLIERLEADAGRMREDLNTTEKAFQRAHKTNEHYYNALYFPGIRPCAVQNGDEAVEISAQKVGAILTRNGTLENLVDRAYKMMGLAGYRVAEHNPEHNNPIIAWMADARAALADTAMLRVSGKGEG